MGMISRLYRHLRSLLVRYVTTVLKRRHKKTLSIKNKAENASKIAQLSPFKPPFPPQARVQAAKPKKTRPSQTQKSVMGVVLFSFKARCKVGIMLMQGAKAAAMAFLPFNFKGRNRPSQATQCSICQVKQGWPSAAWWIWRAGCCSILLGSGG